MKKMMILVICMFLMGCSAIEKSDKSVSEFNKINAATAEDYYLVVESKLNVGINYSDPEIMFNRADSIIIGEVTSIQGALNYCAKTDSYTHTFTLANIDVKEVIKGNDITANSSIEIMRLGGVLSLEQYRQGLETAQIQKLGIDKLSMAARNTVMVKDVIKNDILIQPE